MPWRESSGIIKQFVDCLKEKHWIHRQSHRSQLGCETPLDAENQFVTGGGFNYGHTNYAQGMNNAVFNPVPYMTGVTPYYPTAVVSGSNAYTNLFATDTLSPVSSVTVGQLASSTISDKLAHHLRCASDDGP